MEIDRTRRVGELIQRELALIINSELSDPRVGLVTVTDVKVSRDLKTAKAYVTEFSSKIGHEELIAVLTSAAGYLRCLLSQRTELRVTPKLIFVYDTSTDTGFKLTGLIDEARKKDQQ